MAENSFMSSDWLGAFLIIAILFGGGNCSIKTMMLENRLQDTQIALQDAQRKSELADQTATLLATMGKWIANAPAASA